MQWVDDARRTSQHKQTPDQNLAVIQLKHIYLPVDEFMMIIQDNLL